MERIRRFTKQKAGITGEIMLTGRGEHTTSVIKQSFVDEEYSGWKLLHNHIRMLPTRKIELEGIQSLLVKYYDSIPLSHMIKNEIPESLTVFDDFFGDLTKMWNLTKRAYSEGILKYNAPAANLRTLDKFREAALARLGIDLDKHIIINGISTLSLRDFFDLQGSAFRKIPPYLVLSHGDEHFGNILYGEQGYKLIDAHWAGFYDPAWVLAYIYSRMFIFNVSYPVNIKENRLNQVTKYELNLGQIDIINQISSKIIDYINHQADDSGLRERTAAYVANGIGRSIAFLRYKEYFETCKLYGRQHFLQALIETAKILRK